MRKLILEDFIDDIDYTLIGIHCSIEDYRLTYLVNHYLGLKLKRKDVDIEYKDTSSYSIFEWNDQKQQTIWNLVANISKIEVNDAVDATSLFVNQEKFTKTNYLIPEYKKVNFILKISDDPYQHLQKQALNKILEIPQVITAFGIDANKLKTTEQLIFN
ncbi:IPExxxVDY family protein [Oceanihabitans sp. 1_MG-2023]|uniref:IPExxxVDY family protein n=1 Tax=Flavobacteriaceae TaxID=49546 RepID=UPI002090C247|nr:MULTISPECIES: IPExxxVDY family protein [Flavobacteriaceae]MDO6621247.1 IPExxxVDY family protein [Oceanihabitans sp. 1_MG-2023]